MNRHSGDFVGLLAKNLWMLTASQLLYRVVSLLLAVYVARALGADDVGIFYTAFGLIMIFASFTDLGITNLIIKEVSQDRTLIRSYLDNFFFLQTIIGLLFIAAINAAGGWIQYDGMTRHLLLLGSVIPLLSGLANCFNALLSAQEFIYPFAAIEIVCLVVYLIGNTLVIVLRLGVDALMIVSVSTSVVKLALAFWWGNRFSLRVGTLIDVGVMKHLIVVGFPFLLFNGLHFVLQRVDVVLLSLYVDPTTVGYYAAVSRLVFAAIIFATVIAAVLYPTLSRVVAEDPARANTMAFRATEILISLSAGLGIFTTLAGRWFIPFLYGDRFLISVPSFATLGWFVLLFSAGIVYGNLLMVSGRLWQAVAANFVSFLVLAGASILLIPRFGFIGSAYAVVLGEATRAIIFLVYSRVALKHHVPIESMAKLTIITALALACGYLLVQDPIVRCILAIVIYCVGIILTRVIRAEHVQIAKQMIFRKQYPLADA